MSCSVDNSVKVSIKISFLIKKTHISKSIIYNSQKFLIKIWDIGSGECLSTLTGHNDEVNCVVTF